MSGLRVPSEVLNLSRLVEADAGDVLATQAGDGAEVFVIESGLLQIDRELPNGERSVRIAGPGEVVGEEAILNDSYSQHLEALAPSRVLAMRLFHARSDLEVCKWLLGQLTMQLQQTDREIHWMRNHSVENRVQLHLLSLHDKTNGSKIPVSQAVFAHVVGATRETISTALNRLARAEVIRLSRRSITVLRPESLGLRNGHPFNSAPHQLDGGGETGGRNGLPEDDSPR